MPPHAPDGGAGREDAHDRLPELHSARRDGVVMRAACADVPHVIGAFDPELHRDAVADLRTPLSVIAEIGGASVMPPGAYGTSGRPGDPAVERRLIGPAEQAPGAVSATPQAVVARA